ncbi:flagella basal body P-ring formation protein FlgA [Qipengyuania sp.]|uniref:flagella basal body P-ring formation protein FlgA n=1 Tax=Qipengyuania sp. TaxID=2004515 RepID=UPI0035C826CC
MWRKPAFLITPLLMVAAPAASQNLTPPSHIDALVAAFTGKAIGQPGGARQAVDPRLRLTACDQGATAEWYGSQEQSVKVSCPVPGGWRVFVPVMGSERSQPVISRGDLVQVRVSGAGFSMSTRAEALQTGAVGATISVRPSYGDVRKSLSAKVLEAGVVGIDVP